MLIKKLKLNYFGRFQNREIELKPGINLIYGDNEAGKSTIHTFIKGMLFGIERLRGRGAATKEDTYTRYLPWDYPGAYSGSMDLQVGDKEYRLQRSFHANDKSFTLLELSTGREVKLKEGLIQELVPGLTEATFKNTISIEQLKAHTDAELAAQVRNYIANLSITKSKEVNVAKAVSVLTDQRKQLEPTLNLAALKSLQAEIADGIEKEKKIDELSIQLKELLVKEKQLLEQKEQLSAALDNEDTRRMEQLPAILEKYRSYQEMAQQAELLEQQEKELAGKITAWEKEQHSIDSLKEDIRETEQLRIRLTELEKQEPELERERESCGRATNPFLFSFPSVVLSMILMILSGGHPIGLITGILLIGGGVYLHIRLNNSKKKKQADIQVKSDALNRQKEAVQRSIDQILKKNQVSNSIELTGKQEELLKNFYSLENARQQRVQAEQRRKELEDSRDILYETIMKYIQYFTREEELSPASMQRLQEEIRRRKQDTQGELSQISSQYDNCRLRIEKLRWEIQTMEGNEEQLLQNQERCQQLEKTIKDNTLELEAMKLALSTIQELSSEIHDTFGQQLNQAVSEVIREVTKDKYNDLKVDEKLEVKVGWNSGYVPLDRLSAGTIDQVYFALRLAVADLLLGKDEVPLLLDDSFALYDESRVKTALERIGQRKQIILFTCHKREQNLLQNMGLPYHFIDLSCETEYSR